VSDILAQTVHVQVSARTKWMHTGVMISKPPAGGRGNRFEIYDRHTTQWTAHPTQGHYYAAGDPKVLSVRPGYAMPGAREGALIGRIGDNGGPIFIGDRGNIDATFVFWEGELQLIINDDLDGRFGQGFNDNDGSVDIVINIYVPGP